MRDNDSAQPLGTRAAGREFTVGSLREICSNCFNSVANFGLAVAARSFDKELARRDARRGKGTYRWFVPEEAAAVESLGRIIIPSDEETPGLDEVGVLDAPAVVTLDRMIAASPTRQHAYSRGLLSFDVWALEQDKCTFSQMSTERQVAVFAAAERFNEAFTDRGSTLNRVLRRLQDITHVRKGIYFASLLYSQIRTDCLQVFYTSRVSWTWLEYDGPPMEKGYPDLVERR